MVSISPPPPPTGKILVGVETHKHVHVAVAIDDAGVRLGDYRTPVDVLGYAALGSWATSLGPVHAFGIEGTGNYGAGLTSFLRRQGHRVVEVNRDDRRARRANGKNDSLDAELAARSVLAGTSMAVPKSADGVIEMILQIKVARDTAQKNRTGAIVTLKTIVVNAPDALRAELSGLSNRALLERCTHFRPGAINTPLASTKLALRSLARRFAFLESEIKELDRHLDTLTMIASPTHREGFGIASNNAAEILIVLGDNLDRVTSEAAFAKLCGVCPRPVSSGMTDRYRLSRSGHRQANDALYRTVLVRLQHHQPTIDYFERRTAEGLSKRDVIRCLKRFVAREVYGRVVVDFRARQLASESI